MPAPPASPAQARAAAPALWPALLLFFASGVSGLVYEILWVRQLTLVFGATVFAVSTVLAVFMAGLAAGSLAVGWWVDRRPRWGLATYGVLQVLLGLYALALPHLIPAWTPLYAWARAQFGMSFWGVSMLKLVATAAVLLPATALMGGTLPALARHVVRERAELAPRVALLYGVNTLGAVLGCVGAAFVLVHELGVQQTLYVAAGLNVAAGLAAFALASGGGRLEPAAHDGGGQASSRPHVLWLYAACGFCALAYETLWTRMLAHVVGTDVQAFALMLTAFLLGIAGGSLAVSAIGPARRRPLSALALVEWLVAGSVLLSIPAFALLPLATKAVGAGAPAASAVQCLVVMLVPTTLMGAAFPLASHAYAPGLHHVGRGVGRVYAANTLAGVAGSLIAGFGLVPAIGAQRGLWLMAAVNAAAAACLTQMAPVSRRGAKLAIGVVWAAVCAAAALPFAARPLTTFLRPSAEFELLYYNEGVSSSVSVLRSLYDPSNRELDVNGVPVAVTSFDDLKIQKLLAHVPLLLHPDPQDALLIGFGTGSTAYSATLLAERVTCVELEAGQSDTARWFADINHGVLSHPRFRLHIDDGRNWLLTTPALYDVICRDTLHPKLSQDLFSREFYALCRSRLAPGGMMAGILPMDICPSEAYFKQLIRTFQSVFPQASVWYVGPQLAVLVGGTDPFRIDWSRMVQARRDPAVRADLAMVDLEDPVATVSYLLMEGAALRAYVGPGPVIEDDRPLGFRPGDRSLPREDSERLTEHLIAAKQSPFERMTNVPQDRAKRTDLELKLHVADRVAKHVIRARGHTAWGQWLAGVREFEAALALSPHDANVRHGLSRANNKRAQTLFTAGRPREAEALLREAIRLNPAFVQPYVGLARCLEKQGRSREAGEVYRKVQELQGSPHGVAE